MTGASADLGGYRVEITGLCTRVAKSVVQQRQKISEDATSHDKITEIHWHFYKLASEGHIGWKAAISLLEQIWIEDVMDRDKRSRAELRGELFRSSINALRKIKTQVDQRIAVGAIAVEKSCGCRGALHVIREGEAGLDIHTATGTSVTLGSGLGVGGSSVNGLAEEDDGESWDEDAIDFDNLSFQYAVVDDNGEIVGIKGEADDGNNDQILRWVLNGVAKSPEEYAMNDDGNAQHFYDLFSPVGTGPVLRWVEGIGWLVWCSGGVDALTGQVQQPRWVTDTDGLIRRAWWLVKRRQEMYAEGLANAFSAALSAAQIAGPGNAPINNNGNPTGALLAQRKIADSWAEFARKSGNNVTANAAIEALKQKEGVTMDINEFDANPFLIGVANGVIDLREAVQEYDERGNVIGVTPLFRDAHPDDLILLNTGVEYKRYDRTGTTARKQWERYLDTFINVGPDGKSFCEEVQMFFGYGLIGSNPERIFLLVYGPSSTGKSTLLNAVGAALGDYAMTANISMYQNHKLNPVLARALSKRIVMTSELSDGSNFSIEVLKNITGNEVVSAELKGSNAIVERRPSFLPIVATNVVPDTDGVDDAVKRRMVALPFENAVDPAKTDASISIMIETEAREAVLSWLVDGYFKYKFQGSLPKFSEKLKQAQEKVLQEMDPIQAFLAECVIKNDSIFGKQDVEITPEIKDNWVLPVNKLFEIYENWCNSKRIHAMKRIDSRKLTIRLKGLGFVHRKARVNDGNLYVWVGIKSAVKRVSLSSNNSLNSIGKKD